MKELISRQVVLAEVGEWLDQRGIDGAHLLAVLEQIPIEGGWISVEERLPEHGECVAILLEREYHSAVLLVPAIGQWHYSCGGYWTHSEKFPGAKVTHWFPLPEKTKEEM